MDNTSPTPASTPVPSSSESHLWKGTTSQFTHFWFYLLCIVVAVALVVGAIMTGHHLLIAFVGLPIIAMLVRSVVTRSVIYELSDQRLRVTRGILSLHVDDMELYRVKDYSLDEPFPDRFLGLGNITLITSDASTPTVNIRAVPDAKKVMDLIRHAVETARDRKRVRQMDVDSLDDGSLGHH